MWGMILFLIAPNTAFRRIAKPALQMHYADTGAAIWSAARIWQKKLAPTRPRHSTMVNMMMRHFEWANALYRALLDHRIDGDEARQFVETVVSDVYRPVPRTMFKMSRLRSADRRIRVKFLFKMVTRYFFSAPFHHRHLEAEDGVSFDVTVCPLAVYFAAQGMPELTRHAACRIDYCMADAYGMTLTRTQTIAKGDAYCDFRWTFRKDG